VKALPPPALRATSPKSGMQILYAYPTSAFGFGGGGRGAGVVARVELQPPKLRSGGAPRRGRMSEAGRQIEGLFESLFSQSFER
jgi:hypothetical protein